MGPEMKEYAHGICSSQDSRAVAAERGEKNEASACAWPLMKSQPCSSSPLVSTAPLHLSGRVSLVPHRVPTLDREVLQHVPTLSRQPAPSHSQRKFGIDFKTIGPLHTDANHREQDCRAILRLPPLSLHRRSFPPGLRKNISPSPSSFLAPRQAVGSKRQASESLSVPSHELGSTKESCIIAPNSPFVTDTAPVQNLNGTNVIYTRKNSKEIQFRSKRRALVNMVSHKPAPSHENDLQRLDKKRKQCQTGCQVARVSDESADVCPHNPALMRLQLCMRSESGTTGHAGPRSNPYFTSSQTQEFLQSNRMTSSRLVNHIGRPSHGEKARGCSANMRKPLSGGHEHKHGQSARGGSQLQHIAALHKKHMFEITTEDNGKPDRRCGNFRRLSAISTRALSSQPQIPRRLDHVLSIQRNEEVCHHEAGPRNEENNTSNAGNQNALNSAAIVDQQLPEAGAPLCDKCHNCEGLLPVRMFAEYRRTQIAPALLRRITHLQNKINRSSHLQALMKIMHERVATAKCAGFTQPPVLSRTRFDCTLIEVGFPPSDKLDVDICLDTVPGLSEENLEFLKKVLQDQLGKVRLAARERIWELDEFLFSQYPFRIVTFDDLFSRRRRIADRFLEARKAILEKYGQYVRSRRWIENLSTRQRRGCLNHHQNNTLRLWLYENFLNPYPTGTKKRMLTRMTSLTIEQVNNWLINARSRFWRPILKVMLRRSVGIGFERGAKKSLNDEHGRGDCEVGKIT